MHIDPQWKVEQFLSCDPKGHKYDCHGLKLVGPDGTLERMQTFQQQGIRDFTIIYCEACPLHPTERILARGTQDAPWNADLRPRRGQMVFEKLTLADKQGLCDRTGKAPPTGSACSSKAAREPSGYISSWAHKRHSRLTPGERWLFHTAITSREARMPAVTPSSTGGANTGTVDAAIRSALITEQDKDVASRPDTHPDALGAKDIESPGRSESPAAYQDFPATPSRGLERIFEGRPHEVLPILPSEQQLTLSFAPSPLSVTYDESFSGYEHQLPEHEPESYTAGYPRSLGARESVAEQRESRGKKSIQEGPQAMDPRLVEPRPVERERCQRSETRRDERMGRLQAHIEQLRITGPKPLNPEERRQATDGLAGGSPCEVLCSRCNVDLTRKHLSCLAPREWLNDKVINFYLKLLQERDDASGDGPKLWFPNSLFWATLGGQDGRTYNYQGVRRWNTSACVNLFKLDCTIFSMNIGCGTHWSVGVIDIRQKGFRYFDSKNEILKTEIIRAFLTALP